MPVRLAVRRGDAWEAVRDTPWMASAYYQKKQRYEQYVSVRVVADQGIIPTDVGVSFEHTIQDVPISFDSERRTYTLRTVEEARVDLENPQYVEARPNAGPGLVHDPMEVL